MNCTKVFYAFPVSTANLHSSLNLLHFTQGGVYNIGEYEMCTKHVHLRIFGMLVNKSPTSIVLHYYIMDKA